MHNSFSQLTEYFRLIDKFNSKSTRFEYKHQSPHMIRNNELKQLAYQIEDMKYAIQNTRCQ